MLHNILYYFTSSAILIFYNMDIKCINRKGGIVLLHDGRQYYKLRTYKNGKTFWTCSRLKKEKCRGSITVDMVDMSRGDHNSRVSSGGVCMHVLLQMASTCRDDRSRRCRDDHDSDGSGQIVKCTDHLCLRDFNKNEMDIAMHELKQKAMTTEVPIPELYREAKETLKNKGLNFVTPIPPLVNIKSTLYNKRSKTCFTDLADVTIPDQYQFFLLAEYETKICRILIFCTENGKELLAKSKEIFVDGTFFCCPIPFKQMFSIHVDIAQSTSTTKVKPVAYALMSDKTQESYVALFQLIKSQIPQWTPGKIHMDFEIAASNAIREIFSDIKIVKCYYHFIKSLWKRAKKMKIKSKIESRIVGLCSALPLLPADKIDAGWEYIKEESLIQSRKVKQFNKYFENAWLKDTSFKSQWSVYGERHRTNNAVESWHAQLNKIMKRQRPITVARLLPTLLKLEENDNEPSPRRKEYMSRDVLIMNCQLQLIHNEISIGHFLDKLR